MPPARRRSSAPSRRRPADGAAAAADARAVYGALLADVAALVTRYTAARDVALAYAFWWRERVPEAKVAAVCADVSRLGADALLAAAGDLASLRAGLERLQAEARRAAAAAAAACFASWCTLLVVGDDGAERATAVGALRRGDAVATAGGGTARVVCVAAFRVPPSSGVVQIPNGPALTTGHPVLWTGAWRRAGGLGALVPSGGTVYNLVLDASHAPLVDGYACITLGHGLPQPPLAHPFWGTAAVVHALARLRGWAAGAVTVARVVKDAAGHTTSFVEEAEEAEEEA